MSLAVLALAPIMIFWRQLAFLSSQTFINHLQILPHYQHLHRNSSMQNFTYRHHCTPARRLTCEVNSSRVDNHLHFPTTCKKGCVLSTIEGRKLIDSIVYVLVIY
jgi:hypothetical protein